MIHPLQAFILGIVEGLSEYLPISSTGHLILASHFLGLHGEGIKTFEIVIQAGAIAAVPILYRGRITSPGGGRLARNLFISFLPAVAAGLLLHRVIKEKLFDLWPVVVALALGGILMIAVDFRFRSSRRVTRTLDSLTAWEALWIGLAQCLSLWPGASRAMVTIVAGLFVGLSATQAAEYSFLLALPTLGAATLFDWAKGGAALLHEVGLLSILCGFVTAAVVAAVAIRGFIRYLTSRGLAPFGWYRLALAFGIWLLIGRG